MLKGPKRSFFVVAISSNHEQRMSFLAVIDPRVTWELLFWPTCPTSSVCKPTTFFVTERGFSFYHTKLNPLQKTRALYQFFALNSNCRVARYIFTKKHTHIVPKRHLTKFLSMNTT